MATRLDEVLLANLLQILKRVEAHEREVRQAYRDSLAEIQRLLSDAYLRYGRDNTIPYAEAAKYGRLAALEKALVDELRRLGDNEVRRLDRTLTGVYRESYYRTAWTLDGLAGIRVSFAQLPTAAIREILRFPWSGARYSERLYQDTQLLAQRVKETMVRGMIQGHSVQQMAADLQARYETGHANAIRIVRTESIHFSNAASVRVYADAGIDQVEWLATLDARTCSECGALDRKVFDRDEAPGPPLHPNCRCTLIPHLTTAQPGRRIARGPDGTYYVSGDTTYEQWLQQHGIKAA